MMRKECDLLYVNGKKYMTLHGRKQFILLLETMEMNAQHVVSSDVTWTTHSFNALEQTSISRNGETMKRAT